MDKRHKKAMSEPLRRFFHLDRESVDLESRSVQLSFSSEEPYERFFGTEILGHKTSEVNLDRLKSGTHPLLLQHDDNQQIGVVEKAWIDKETKKGRAKVRFAGPTNQLAEMVFNDVKDGIRSNMSVGYRVDKWKRINEPEGDDQAEADSNAIYRAVSWTPFELSIVAVPADGTVGINRKHDPKDNPMDEDERRKIEKQQREEAERRAKAKEEARKEFEAEQKAKAAEEKRKREELEKMKRDYQQRLDELAALRKRFKDQHELIDKAEKEDWPIDKLNAELIRSIPEGKPLKPVLEPEVGQSHKTVGQLFIESDQYKQLAKRFSSHRTTISVEIPRTKFERATTSPSNVFSATTESLSMEQRLPGIPGMLDQQPLAVSSLFAQGTTNAVAIRYVIEDAFTNNAAVTSEGSAKTEGDLDVSEATESVYKCAVWLTITDEMLADYAGMRSFIDGRLAYMVGAKEDDLCLDGSGSSQTTGVNNLSGVNTEDASTAPVQADAIYRAITKVRTAGFIEPDAIVMHPNDYRDYRLQKDGQGQYHGGGPFFAPYGNGQFSNVANMWGLPVLQTTFQTEGSAVVGAFRMASQLFRRQGLTLESTNSHENDFIANRITIRAETRFALVHYKPLGYCVVSNIA